jgi:5-methylcytosine-specific restriction endonuclease McrA
MDETKGFYKTSAWLKCRAAYIKSVGGLCERCLKDGKIVPGYIVHHKCYLNATNIQDPSITLNWDNLEYLCHDCHNKEHFKESTAPRYKIRTDGTVDII